MLDGTIYSKPHVTEVIKMSFKKKIRGLALLQILIYLSTISFADNGQIIKYQKIYLECSFIYKCDNANWSKLLDRISTYKKKPSEDEIEVGFNDGFEGHKIEALYVAMNTINSLLPHIETNTIKGSISIRQGLRGKSGGFISISSTERGKTQKWDQEGEYKVWRFSKLNIDPKNIHAAIDYPGKFTTILPVDKNSQLISQSTINASPSRTTSESTRGSPLTLFGLNFGMSITERVNSVSTRGYNCEQKLDLKYEPYYCTRYTQDGKKFHWQGREIEISENVIDFDCSVFNVCSYNLDEVAKMLVDQRIVRPMQYRDDSMPGLKLIQYSYCSRGDMGDVLCIENYSGRSARIDRLILNKGAFGIPNPIFR